MRCRGPECRSVADCESRSRFRSPACSTPVGMPRSSASSVADAGMWSSASSMEPPPARRTYGMGTCAVWASAVASVGRAHRDAQTSVANRVHGAQVEPERIPILRLQFQSPASPSTSTCRCAATGRLCVNPWMAQPVRGSVTGSCNSCCLEAVAWRLRCDWARGGAAAPGCRRRARSSAYPSTKGTPSLPYSRSPAPRSTTTAWCVPWVIRYCCPVGKGVTTPSVDPDGVRTGRLVLLRARRRGRARAGSRHSTRMTPPRGRLGRRWSRGRGRSG